MTWILCLLCRMETITRRGTMSLIHIWDISWFSPMPFSKSFVQVSGQWGGRWRRILHWTGFLRLRTPRPHPWTAREEQVGSRCQWARHRKTYRWRYWCLCLVCLWFLGPDLFHNQHWWCRRTWSLEIFQFLISHDISVILSISTCVKKGRWIGCRWRGERWEVLVVVYNLVVSLALRWALFGANDGITPEAVIC